MLVFWPSSGLYACGHLAFAVLSVREWRKAPDSLTDTFLHREASLYPHIGSGCPGDPRFRTWPREDEGGQVGTHKER
jgi:hypothetical protein